MRNHFYSIPAFLGCLGVLAFSPHALAGSAAIKVGMTQSFFHDMSPPLIETVTEPFIAIMRDTTGLTGKLAIGGDAFAVAQQVSDKKLELGVFHGFEFAWLQKKHPELRPLMIALNSQHPLRAIVLVPKESAAKTFADLKGKDLAIPKRTKQHCRYFVDRLCRDAGAGDAKEFFGKVILGASVETALNDLAAGKVQAAVVGATGLEFYKDLNPGRFAKLRVLTQSEVFPAMVIAHRQGTLDDATLAKIREGLRAAPKTQLGRDMLKMWDITSIDPAPDSFAEILAASLKTFPMPESK